MNISDIWYRTLRWFRELRIRRNIRFTWQIWTKGWCDSDTWSLDSNIAHALYPRLKRFKELNNGSPWNLKPGEWDEILDKIIRTFEFLDSDGKYDLGHLSEEDKKKWKEIEEGLDLFRQYFFDLWW